MKKEQISFLSHSISPFFCLIWFLSSHLSFFSPFHLHSSVSPYCFFNILFYLSFLPLPRSLNRDPQPSIFYLFIFHVLSCTFLPSLPVFPLPYFCSSLFPPWFFSFHFFHFSILFFFIYSILSFLHSLSHIHSSRLFSLFFTLLQRTWGMQRLLNGRNNEIKWSRNPPRTKHIFSFSSSKSYEFFMFQSSSLMK